jgi:hypothetical protein
MRLDELARRIDAQVLTTGRAVSVDQEQVYAGDRISDLLNAAGDHMLLVSNLASAHLMRVAELMDIPGICLVHGQAPGPAMLKTATDHGTLLMVSPFGLYETCGRIYDILAQEQRSSP